MDELGYASFEDWCDWNEGKISDKEWEEADTMFLFTGRNDDEIAKIYSYFPQGPELLKRYFRARRNRLPATDHELFRIVKQDIANMQKISLLAQNNKLADFLNDQISIKFESTNSLSSQTESSGETLYDFLETINDYVTFNSIDQSPNANDIESGLFHAHGNNFQVTHALLGPLIKNGHLFEAYLDLYAKKVHYEVFESGVTIYR